LSIRLSSLSEVSSYPGCCFRNLPSHDIFLGV
jgi:hypothetical protein